MSGSDPRPEEAKVPTWEDVEQRARHCPHIHVMMGWYRMIPSKETVLIATVLHLSRVLEEKTQQEVERKMREVPESLSSHMLGRD